MTTIFGRTFLSSVMLGFLSAALCYRCAEKNSISSGDKLPPVSTPAPSCAPGTTCTSPAPLSGITGPTAPGAAIDVCASLQAATALAEVAEYAAKLCSPVTATNPAKLIDVLRLKQYVYDGLDDVNALQQKIKTQQQSSESTGKSSMRLYTSTLATIDPKSFFNMVRLQQMQPAEFRKFFEFDEQINYTPRTSDNQTTVTFAYERSEPGRPEAKVSYSAKSTFVTVQEGAVYAYYTIKTPEGPQLLVDAIKALVVIAAKGSQTEIFTLSDQTYDNQGNHSRTLDEVIAALAKEQQRTFKNAQKATAANTYYPR